MSFAQAQLAEIRNDRALTRYAALLALVHPLTAFAWLAGGTGLPLPSILARGGVAVCWPFFPGCADVRVLDADALRALVIGYGALGVLAAALWLGKVRGAWWLHLALELFKVALVVQDYRLRLNEHHMALFAALAFLLLPAKRDATRVTLVLFYVWAGLLKLSPDWLSGLALPQPPLGVPAALVPLACKLVVALELVGAWGLLARRAAIFWGALGSLVLFHLSSWSVVGFFYPVLMFVLLAIFPLARPDDSKGSSVLARVTGGLLPGSAYAFFALYSALQLWPRLFPGDPALSGEGRWLALHMFDARIDCRASMGTHELQLPDALRIRCDPLVVRARALAECAQLGDFDLVLQARRSSDAHYRRVIDAKDFCSKTPNYRALSHNAWIHAE